MAADYVNPTKVILTNVVCDNAASNIAALQILGAKLSYHDNLKPHLDVTNACGEKIYVVLDTSHLIKLARNTLGDLQLLFTGDGRPVMWNLVRELEKLQGDEGLHLGNRIRKEHVQYQKKKMRVYLATQVLSDSVADAIEFCDKDIKLQQFADSSGTCEYLRVFNLAFDILDSKVPFMKHNKMPLKLTNKDQWMTHFKTVEDFILSLHLTNPTAQRSDEPETKRSKKDTRLICSQRKKGFLGFLVNLKTYRDIFSLYVEEKKFLNYILGHKLSQDHLELMFGTIRSSLGKNNNPTVIQFNSALKKVLLGATHTGLWENCISQDETTLLLPTSTSENLSLFSEKYDLNSGNGDQWLNSPIDLYLAYLQSRTLFKENVLNYVAGFIQRQIRNKEQCVHCRLFMSNIKDVHACSLLDRKNRGGLTLPSVQLEKVVQISEAIFSNLLKTEGNPFKVRKIVEKISQKTCKEVFDNHPTLLSQLDDHCEVGSHRNLMIKKIVGCFISMRCKHFAKEHNQQNVKVRVQLSKLILFKNQ